MHPTPATQRLVFGVSSVAGNDPKQPFGDALIKTQFFTLTIAALVLVVGFLAVQMMTGTGGLSMIEPSDREKREAAIFRLNLGTPKDIGNGVQLDRVSSSGGGVLYQFTLTLLASTEVDAVDFHDFVFETSRAQMCSHPDLRSFIEAEDGFVESEYHGNDGEYVTSNRFDKAACQPEM